MEKPHVYLMPGLGFDERIFYNLQFENAVPHYLKWEEPQINESLNNYVKRISEQINNTKPFILIGHSFGGIIVQEISKIITPEKVIIISSIKSKEEIPVTLKFLKKIPLYKFFNQKLILATFPIWARAFGYRSEKGRALFVQMISNCTDNYFRWAMDKIVNWNGNPNADKVMHIHGSNDKTFFVKKIKNPTIIPDGSHFMVFSKAEEVSQILKKVI